MMKKKLWQSGCHLSLWMEIKDEGKEIHRQSECRGNLIKMKAKKYTGKVSAMETS